MLRTLKVFVGGKRNVGKTSLIQSYTHATVSDMNTITAGIDVTTQLVELEGRAVNLALWDVEGEASCRPNLFLGAQAAMLVYDATDEESLQALTGWYARCKRYCPGAPLVVVGNKIDLGLRFPSEWARVFAYIAGAQHGFLSARTGEYVRRGFEILAREAMRHAGVLEPVS